MAMWGIRNYLEYKENNGKIGNIGQRGEICKIYGFWKTGNLGKGGIIAKKFIFGYETVVHCLIP